MNRRSLIGIAMFSLFSGCSHDKTENIDGIEVKDITADVPAFKREYRGKLTSGRLVLVTARTGYGRYYSGELDQLGGRWVLFDPEAVADKIIDPELVPQVEEFCQRVISIDKQFIDSAPGSFIDESGQKWVRVS